ncbi:MAG: hypothetical protein ACYDBH_01515 [Acidobacteriaceae bacterium]
MMATQADAARSAYDIAFQVSPIILTGGIASGMLGNAIPIIALVGQLAGFAQGALTSGFSFEDFYARFLPIHGSTVISNTVGTYPFANQSVAANALVQQPLTVSLQMIAPVKDAGGYLTKLPIFMNLQQSLQAHNIGGGTYTIATPSYIYTNCLMTNMSDITSGETNQQQIIWQLDFVQPLISLQDATNAVNGLMSKLQNAQATNGQWSGQSGVPSPGALNGLTQQSAGVINFTPTL